VLVSSLPVPMSAVRDYFCQLNRSFAAMHAALKSRRVVRWVLVALLSIHTLLLGYSAYVHSPTLNEPGHLVAGLSYWKFGRFDLYSVNPPLVKMVAALPVMAAGYKEDWSGFYGGPGARPELAMGKDFVAANGERSFFLFMISRWACIPFSWVGAIICYLWARDLFGRPAGVLAATIWCFEPNILAHAALINSDAAGAALGAAACYTFWRWLRTPSWSQAGLTGVVLGLAELTKTTLIVFYPLWPLMWLAYRWSERRAMTAKAWLSEAGMLLVRMAIGIYIVNVGYGFEGSLQPLKKFVFVSDLFTGGDANARVAAGGDRSRDATPDNRFAESWLGTIPVPFPQHYLIGIDLQQKDLEHYDRPSYLRGKWRDHGWWYYYLYGALIKVPLGLWGLGLLALGTTLTGSKAASHGSIQRDILFLFTPAVVIFSFVSSQTEINEHFRYVLPAFPFVFICLSKSASNFFSAAPTILIDTASSTDKIRTGSARRVPKPLGVYTVIASFRILLLWSVVSSCWIYPHTLAYFNELVGGPLEGPRHLLGSSVDWGQDQRYLLWAASPRTGSLSHQGGFFVLQMQDLVIPHFKAILRKSGSRDSAETAKTSKYECSLDWRDTTKCITYAIRYLSPLDVSLDRSHALRLSQWRFGSEGEFRCTLHEKLANRPKQAATKLEHRVD
jgi:hypothetical protein